MRTHLEDPLGISCHSSMQRRPAHVVLDVGVSAGLQQAFGSVRASVAGGQVKSGFTCTVSLVVKVSALVDEVVDHVGRGILLFLAVARFQTSPAAGCNHQRCESVWTQRGEGEGGFMKAGKTAWSAQHRLSNCYRKTEACTSKQQADQNKATNKSNVDLTLLPEFESSQLSPFDNRF